MASTIIDLMVLIPVLIKAIGVKTINLCHPEWLNAAPAAPGGKPPLRSQGHIGASAAYLASQQTFAADVVGATSANRRLRQDELETLKDALTFWEKQDKYNKDKYEEELKNFTDYSTFCGTVETLLGVLGPTGTEKNKLFGEGSTGLVDSL
jgi:hypothetical protein